MIDRKSRNKLAESCRHYWSCIIDNFEFDKTNFKIRSGSDDKGVKYITGTLWHLYDDIRRHKNSGKWKLSEENEVVFKRIILFLKSDIEYTWTHPSVFRKLISFIKTKFISNAENKILKDETEGNYEFWPFYSEMEYKTALSQPKYLNRNVY